MFGDDYLYHYTSAWGLVNFLIIRIISMHRKLDSPSIDCRNHLTNFFNFFLYFTACKDHYLSTQFFFFVF